MSTSKQLRYRMEEKNEDVEEESDLVKQIKGFRDFCKIRGTRKEINETKY